MFEEIKKQAEQAALELIKGAKLQPGQLVEIGCSSSEMVGERIGKGSSMQAAQAVYEGMAPVFKSAGVHIAAQCCEHLNRALVVENALAEQFGYEIVNAIPQPDAGGSFPVTVYKHMTNPVLVEDILADAGIDIGGTLIGMHLKKVAVPVRLNLSKIGQANILCARTRPKYIGGARAKYLEK
ncbi:MAG: TIGR01440 family protein [Clostridiales bacterium]|nr:TIGR01440 family protein [Clostridiales bacterium]